MALLQQQRRQQQQQQQQAAILEKEEARLRESLPSNAESLSSSWLSPNGTRPLTAANTNDLLSYLQQGDSVALQQLLMPEQEKKKKNIKK